MEISFKGKRILVTGAGNGIGLALVDQLWEQKAIVYALDKDEDGLKTLVASHPGVKPICVDLLNWDETRKVLLREITEPLDGLVNNAGLGAPATFQGMTESSFDTVIGVNLRAIVNVSQVVASGMISSGKGGSIVHISSLASRFPTRASLPYNLSKAGVDMLTKSMALELGPHNIRVNSVNPNIVMTALAREWMSIGSGLALKQKLIARTPLGRVGEVGEVVSAILFLLCSSTAPMIHGQSLFVDGGFSAS